MVDARYVHLTTDLSNHRTGPQDYIGYTALDSSVVVMPG